MSLVVSPFVVCVLLHVWLRFKSVSHLYGPVGHTHGPLDQRFSIVTTGLAQAKVLEHPQESLLVSKFWVGC